MSVTRIPSELRRLVVGRAGDCCEYCRLPSAFAYFAHEVDHVVAEKHDGHTVAENLCLACFSCNRHKGSDLASIDPLTGAMTALFHPRRDRWSEHFRFDGARIQPLTAVGRTTARLFQFNTPPRIAERQPLVRAGKLSAP